MALVAYVPAEQATAWYLSIEAAPPLGALHQQLLPPLG